MKIAFANYRECVYGGYPAFLFHLIPGLKSFGHKVEFFYIATKPKKAYRGLGFETHPIHYKKISSVLNDFDIVIIPSATSETNQKKYIPLLDLVKKPKVLVVHDPPEIARGLHYCLDKFDAFLFIRPVVQEWFSKKYPNQESKFTDWIPHPYNRFNPNNDLREKQNLIVDIARVDWDKHQDLLVKAAKDIQAELRIYSGFVNSRYVYHKFKGLDFKKYYKGGFRKPQDVLKNAKIMIDLSAIKNDGGGTQYTFLEAMDAQCVPVVSEKWITEKALMKDGVNCVVVKHNPEGVADGLNKLIFDESLQEKIIFNNFKLLEQRSWKNTIPLYEEYFDNVRNVR